MNTSQSAAFSEAAIEHYGNACRLIFDEIGMGTALTFLYSYLRVHLPLTRIFCGFRRYKTGTYSTVADTWNNAHNRVRTLSTSNLTQEQVDLMMGPDTFEPYIINNAFALSNEITSIRREDLASYLRLPMFNLGEATFQIAFCSNVPHTFNDVLARKLLQLTRPLGQSLSLRFQEADELPQPESTEKSSAAARLALCEGLSDLLQQVEQAARSDCTVLILGETGTGKEIVADAVHELSARRDRPFLKINCGAVNEQLIDSEFFGHEKGAFTGAQGARTGHFEAANGGTILLDEIGDLPLPLQTRLLRVLDRREIQKVGSSRAIPLDIRVIAATHRNLPEMVTQGRFREDLWYRLNVFSLKVAPLRARRMDIPVLTRLFVNDKSRNMDMVPSPAIESAQWEVLFKHNWPGNVRELEHVVERALVRVLGNPTRSLSFDMEEERPTFSFAQPASPLPLPAPEQQADWPSLEKYAETYIARVLEKTGGKIAGPGGAAELLGVHPNTLRLRRKKKQSNGGEA